MPKVKLTAATVEKTKPPEKGRSELWDTQVPGLALRITPNGIKSWCIRYRASGKQKRFTLGTYPAISLADARNEASEAIRNVKMGQDVQREKEATRTAIAPQTLSEAFAVFIESYAKKKNRSWQEVENIFERRVRRKLGKRPLVDITRSDLISLFDAIEAPHSANKAYRYMNRFFGWCIEKNRLDDNPMIAVALPHPEAEVSRDRILSDDEIKLFWDACDQMGYPFGDFFKLLLALGQRREEVGGMCWKDLDINGKVWNLPKEITKNKKAHIVPLSPMSLEIIDAIPRQGKSKWVFTTTGETSISGYSRAKKILGRLIKETLDENELEDIPNWRTHDLRRTFASGLARLKVPQIVVEKTQNRATGEGAGVAGVYNRYSYMDEREAALSAWARYIEVLIKPDADSGEIIEFQAHIV